MTARSTKRSFERLFNEKQVSLAFTRNRGTAFQIGPIQPSPCMMACPAGVNVKAYVSLIAAGCFREALEVVRERNPLPGICGRVCTHPCESFCTRTKIDAPVAICSLKRFVADYELRQPGAMPKPVPQSREERVAVVGSGPAGLTAAHDLVRRGFGVTVFEALPRPGGMLVAGIPSFRLPRSILEYEIEVIRNLGVEIKAGTRIAGKNAIDELFEDGFSAIFLGVGAHKGKKLGLQGEDHYRGIVDAISFLREANLGHVLKPGDKVAVLGGGNSAVDASRTAIRLGCEEVTIVYRRTRDEMPASDVEIEQAESEGVKICYLAAPTQLLESQGRVAGMICTKMRLGEPDESGRRRPVPIEGAQFWIPVDGIITAISQEPDLSFLHKSDGLALSDRQKLAVDASTLATSRAGVFAGGDVVTGPNTVIDAIAAGHLAAQSIERYLDGEPQRAARPRQPVEAEVKLDLSLVERKPRARLPLREGPRRVGSFEEVELGFSEATAVREAQRCLRCGPCHECATCVPECSKALTILSSLDDRQDIVLRFPQEFDDEMLPLMPNAGWISAERKRKMSVNVRPITCSVDPKVCRGCGECVSICEYSAPMLIPKGNGVHISLINEALCKGCGTCAAVCPSGAIVQEHCSGESLEHCLQELDPDKRNVVVFSCRWSGGYCQGLDAGEVNLLAFQPMCSGRIEPSFVLKAFERGAEGVVVVGCPSGGCHYGFGNMQADMHFNETQNLLDILGLEPQRFQWFWPRTKRGDSVVAAIERFLGSLPAREKAGVCE